MKKRTSRRAFLQLATGASGAAILVPGLQGASAAMHDPVLSGAGSARTVFASPDSLSDSRILIEYDTQMRSRISHRSGTGAGAHVPITPWAATESLLLTGHIRVEAFELHDRSTQNLDGILGHGKRLRLSGLSDGSIEKTIELEVFDRYPGFAIQRVTYRNLSAHPVRVRGWTNSATKLLAANSAGPTAGEARSDDTGPVFWSFCGSTHSDRRDWVQPVRPGFSQQNYMGMSSSDYGGGTPIVDIWRRDGGLAIGHLEPVPELVSLPVNRRADGVELSITCAVERSIPPQGTFSTHQTFVATHTGDYFAVLDTYRRIMADRGLVSPKPPPAAYESIWCAWGYERDCTIRLIADTLPKVKELGLRWAVIDDGWQSNVGDWKINPAKYPRGEEDMLQLVQNIRSHDLKPRLWWAPLAAVPGSDLIHDHTDMLLLDKDGAPQNVTWWNALYLCPAYPRTVDYTLDLVRRFMGQWGFAGLKIDGQHLNSVAPCYNPAHHHARAEDSVEKLPELFAAVYETALKIDPAAVVELCPCGTSYSFFNLRSLNQAPASDPESSWQVRHKGKTLKALMGPSAAYAGDHVELSTGGRDFASTIGVGAVVSTKFTWPVDPKPKDSFLLTPDKEALWRKWLAVYNEHVLPLGTYRGELYDIGFDRPETHVVEKNGRLYYAFYASEFTGPVSLRGLSAGRYRVRDYFNDRTLGEVSGNLGRLQASFKGFLLLEAVPV